MSKQMTRVYTKHYPYSDGHLAIVSDEMDHAGAPILPAVYWKGSLIALAGSHRLAEAHNRGLIPRLVLLLNNESTILDFFFDEALRKMPFYDFDHVLVLDLRGNLLNRRNRRSPVQIKDSRPEIET